MTTTGPTNDDDRNDARPADPRTGAYRLGDLEREVYDGLGRLADQCAKDAERNDGVPLAGGEQAIFAHDRPSTKDQYENPKVEFFEDRIASAAKDRLSAAAEFFDPAALAGLNSRALEDNLNAWRRGKRRDAILRRCEGALLTLAGLVLVLVAWAFMAPRGTP